MRKKAQKTETTPEMVRILKTVNSDMTAYNGFVWPASGFVECPDWSPLPICGNGLHGLLDGYGNSGLFSKDPEAKWLVLEVEKSLVVSIDDEKVKVPSATVIYCGDREGALELLTEEPNRHVSQNFASGASKRIRGTASATGIRGTASATGDSGTACGLGLYCVVESGANGILICKWWDADAKRFRVVVGYVGENGIKANTKYRLDEKGNFVEVTA